LCSKILVWVITANGGLSQYATVPARNVYKHGLKDPHVACLLEIGGVALNAFSKSQLGVTNQNILIIGGGYVGSVCTYLSKRMGAAFICVVDPSKSARECSTQMGANQTLDPSQIMGLTNIQFHLIIETSGMSSEIDPYIKLLCPRGTLVLVGYSSQPLKISEILTTIIKKEISIQGSIGARPGIDYSVCEQFFKDREGDLQPLLGSSFSLQEWRKAFDLFCDNEYHKKISIIP